LSIVSILRARVWDPILHLLRVGTSPAQLAWSAALGGYIGVIPVLGVTTLLCTVVALPLRLNLVAIQAVNWLVYPLQFLLIIPFFKAGAWLFGTPPLTMSPAELSAMVAADPWAAVQALWTTTWQAVVAWLLIGIPVVWLLRCVLVLLFTRTTRRFHPARATGALPS